jgi:2-methylcitrate synthase/citrate synthase II
MNDWMGEDESQEIHKGLEGIYFTESKICKVDGQGGRLYYRGYPIEALALKSSFEEVCYLLLYGKLPNKPELNNFISGMKGERSLPKEVINLIKETSGRAHAMDIARTAISILPAYDKNAYDASEEANMGKAVKLISKLASIVAAIGSSYRGRYTAPDNSLSHAENFLYMLTGKKPGKEKARLLDTMLILHAEHSSNASTFSSLVTGSTLADLYASVTAGMATLKGPLHGGADEAALKMMKEIGEPENTERYINEALSGKARIMGFGHRVYKTYDPRAKIIKAELELLQNDASKEVSNLTRIALTAEQLMVEKLGKTKGIWPNIDFFAGPVYTWIGIAPELFTPLFAASRVPGWCAHMIEYWRSNRLLRPLERYTGQVDLEYIEIEDRE